MNSATHTQLLIIGGGINGAGIAADACGRGLSVRLVEQSDLASATSSASSKLIHGGLRYLEHYEFRLVREALAEREVLLRKAPHIAKPLRFILPHRKHLRPAWMIWCGMFLYDHLSQLNQLPKSKRVKFNSQLDPLKPEMKTGFEYSDCWVDDARLVVLNAMDAANRGGQIHTYTECKSAHYKDGLWHATLENRLTGSTLQVTADMLVNATGPWAQKFIENQLERTSSKRVRLIKGSHLIMPQAYQSDKAYILQNEDRRIVFVIPYLDQFTIIGTTDKEYIGDPSALSIDNDEIEYLLNVYNKHFKTQFNKTDIVSSYAGVRPLCDDESDDPSAMTRDYTIELEQMEPSCSDTDKQAKRAQQQKQGRKHKDKSTPETTAAEAEKGALLNIFGGKLTTYRKLAEASLKKLAPFAPNMGAAWTEYAPLPGGDSEPDQLEQTLTEEYPWLPAHIRRRWIVNYGTLSLLILEACESFDDLGEKFSHDLTEKELIYLIQEEWARTAEDVLWRRTKLGLTTSDTEVAAIEQFIKAYLDANSAQLNANDSSANASTL